MSSRARIGIIAAAVVVLVAGFVLASGSGDDDNKAPTTAITTAVAPAATDPTATAAETTTQPTTTAPAVPAVPTVRVVDAKPQGGVKRISFTKGDTIKFRVRSDTADEIHFHGYDIAKDVKAGGSVTFSVPATIEGRFVVELEHHETEIAQIEVQPS